MNDRRHTILLVEDHDSFALTLETVLSTDPRVEVVDRASDGRAGVELALLHQPDVILMDIYMPTLDGVAATRELAELLPATAVVILSSSDQPTDVERAFDAGAVAFLPKDASLPEIVATVVAASERSEPGSGDGDERTATARAADDGAPLPLRARSASVVPGAARHDGFLPGP